MTLIKSFLLFSFIFLGRKVLANEDDAWRDSIPPHDGLALAARLSNLMYFVDETKDPLNSFAWQFSPTPVTPLNFFHTSLGAEVAVVVSSSAKKVFIVFKGTDGEDADTLADVNFALVSYNAIPGKVHAGFLSVITDENLRPALDEAVKQANKDFPTYDIVVTGHSLGAAISILYGVHLATEVLPSDNIHVWNIGCPRVGNRAFKQAVRDISNLAIWRVVNRDDIIPRVPIVSMGYAHTGHLIHLEKGGSVSVYYQQRGLSGVYEGIDEEDWLIDFESPLVPAFNHAPWEYEKYLNAAADKWPSDFVANDGQVDSCCVTFLWWCWKYCEGTR